jgi:hypothetical protein
MLVWWHTEREKLELGLGYRLLSLGTKDESDPRGKQSPSWLYLDTSAPKRQLIRPTSLGALIVWPTADPFFFRCFSTSFFAIFL